MLDPIYLTHDELLPELQRITAENVAIMAMNIESAAHDPHFFLSETWSANNIRLEQNKMKIQEISLIAKKLKKIYHEFNTN